LSLLASFRRFGVFIYLPMQKLEKMDFEVLATVGAGDIDTFVKPIREMLNKKYA